MKNLFLTIFTIFTATLAQAQDAASFKKFGMGIYAGTQLSGKIYTSEKLSGISGFTGGLDIRYALSREPEGFSLHVQPGFNTFRHYSEEGSQSPFYREATWKWQAVHLPLLVRYTFSSGRIRPFAEIGPMLRFRTALRFRESGYICGFAGCANREVEYDLQSEVTDNPIGLTAGAGLEVDVWKVTIPVSVRIQEAFGTAESKEVGYDDAYFSGLKTRTIQVTAGISF